MCYENGVATLRCIPEFIGSVSSFVFLLAGVVAVGLVIISGIRFMISQGDPGKVAQARSSLTFAIIGLVIVILAYAIVTFVFKQSASTLN